MSNDKKVSEPEKKLIAALRMASTKALACINDKTHDNTRWQLAEIAIVLRDRMHGIRGGTVQISPKALPACIAEVTQVSDAADDADNGPHFDRVVIEGNQAIQMIDSSDTSVIAG